MQLAFLINANLGYYDSPNKKTRTKEGVKWSYKVRNNLNLEVIILKKILIVIYCVTFSCLFMGCNDNQPFQRPFDFSKELDSETEIQLIKHIYRTSDVNKETLDKWHDKFLYYGTVQGFVVFDLWGGWTFGICGVDEMIGGLAFFRHGFASDYGVKVFKNGIDSTLKEVYENKEISFNELKAVHESYVKVNLDFRAGFYMAED